MVGLYKPRDIKGYLTHYSAAKTKYRILLDPLKKVTSSRVTPDGLHVCVSLFRVKSARNCGVSTYLLGGRARRRSAILESGGWVTCDGAFWCFTVVLNTF